MMPPQPTSVRPPATAAIVLARAVAVHRAGRLAEAAEIYEEILAAEPDHADALHLLGLVLHQQQSSEAAAAYIARAVELVPGSVLYRRNLGSVLLALGRLDEATEVYRRVAELEPSARADLELARALLHAGRLEEAEPLFRRALAADPGLAAAHAGLGELCRRRLRLAEAETAYRATLALAPDDAASRSALGDVLRERGALEQAVEQCRRAVELQPDLAVAHSDLGFCLQELGRLDEALAAYRRAVALDARLLKPIAKKLTKGRAGRLWLSPAALRQALGDG